MTVVETLQAALTWYLALTFVGIAVFPLLYVVCRSLPDRGISVYRPVGMAVILLPLWSVGNILSIPFNGWVIGALTVTAGVIAWTYALTRGDILAFLNEYRGTILAFELATLSLFLGYVLFRGFNPDILGTEKPMELAFLNAAINGGELPVQDPWFAGETINYYYFGYAALAAIAIITGIPGEIAFNLGLASAFSLATVAAAGLAANLAAVWAGFERWRVAMSALLAGFFIAAAGNLHAAREILGNPTGTLDASWWGGIGWSSSRVIEDTGFPDEGSRTVITEFPAFSWILGDLHPHVIAYPWLIAAIALTVNFSLVAMTRPAIRQVSLASIPVGLSLAVLYSANSWDVPIVLALFGIALLPLIYSRDLRAVSATIGSVMGAFAIAAGPFAMRYDSPTGVHGHESTSVIESVPGIGEIISSLGYVTWNRSSTGELLTHWGGFLLILVPVVAWLTWSDWPAIRRNLMLILIIVSIAIAGSLILPAPALFLFGVPGILVAAVTLAGPDNRGQYPTAGIIAAGLFVLCVVEFFFVRDPFGDRMNTVFKFSFQVWALFSIGLSVLLPLMLARVRQTLSIGITTALIAVVSVAIIVSSLYAPVSAYRWSQNAPGWNGLDGLAYVERVQPDERAAIDWINNADETFGTILEAPGCAYGSDNFIPHNRISVGTGHATVIGWDGHQHQWRRGQPELLEEVAERIEAAQSIFEQPEDAISLLGQYDITHVVIGVHERDGYRTCPHGAPYAVPDDEALRDLGWEPVFTSSTVRVYRIAD